MSTKTAKSKIDANLTPQQLHKAVGKELSKMPTEEIFQSAVKVGIYTKQGKLKKPYAPAATDEV